MTNTAYSELNTIFLWYAWIIPCASPSYIRYSTKDLATNFFLGTAYVGWDWRGIALFTVGNYAFDKNIALFMLTFYCLIFQQSHNIFHCIQFMIQIRSTCVLHLHLHISLVLKICTCKKSAIYTARNSRSKPTF